MLAVELPKDTTIPARLFLVGWSQCMQAMMLMDDRSKKQVERIFTEQLAPEALCPELRALDEALMVYLLHKCNAKERVGSEVPKGQS